VSEGDLKHELARSMDCANGLLLGYVSDRSLFPLLFMSVFFEAVECWLSCRMRIISHLMKEDHFPLSSLPPNSSLLVYIFKTSHICQ